MIYSDIRNQSLLPLDTLFVQEAKSLREYNKKTYGNNNLLY
jgi:hypothetical protein